jgi:hypothetical protein
MPVPASARKHYRWSAALAERAVREARRARPRGVLAVAGTVVTHQATAAFQAQPAVAQMLTEQSLSQAADALLNTLAFTTAVDSVTAMLDEVETDYEFERLVASLVQDAGRAAEQAATAVRPRVGFVRYLSPPSCSRCAILAGRVYRYSEGFLRHPGCDCVMVPTSLADPAFVHDPVDLMQQGLVTGLSKADQRAIADGADFGQVVNVRSRSAGLSTPGRVLARAGRPTPEAIYARTNTRDEAIQALIAAGYVR